jgi:hypothetical protein
MTSEAPAAPPQTSKWWPLFTVLILPPICAELITGSTAAWIWILPWTLAAFVAIYGAGALAIREISLKFDLGWPGIVVLGLMFGVVNEGIAACTLMNPAAAGLGVDSWYGYYGGVSWVWAFWICADHAMISITFPLFLAEWRWPHIRGRRIISDAWVIVALVAMFASVYLVQRGFAHYTLSAYQWAGLIGAIAVLAVLAFTVAKPAWEMVPKGRPQQRQVFFTAGALFYLGAGIVYTQGAAIGVTPLGNIVELLWIFGLMILVVKRARDGAEGLRDRFAFIAGVYCFFVALSPINEFLAGDIGLVVIDALFVAWIIWLYRRGPGVSDVRSEWASQTALLSELN